MKNEEIILRNVRVHNLKSPSVKWKPNELIVLTGVSGSGKSSLAFDTLFVEGQRRYVESLSNFARRYLGDMVKPDLDESGGITPTISIEQKSTGKNPRSTVGTITEIYDYLRVLYARVGIAHCPISGERVEPQSKERIIRSVLLYPEGSKVVIYAPFARGKKGEFKEDLRDLLRKGFMRARIDGQLVELDGEIALDRTVSHDIDLVIDRLVINQESSSRITEALTTALEFGGGACVVANVDTGKEELFSTHAFSPTSGESYYSLEPTDFSFNSPKGMCLECQGMGQIQTYDLNQVINPELSIAEDCCSIASSYKTVRYGNIYENLAQMYKFYTTTPWKKLSEEAKKIFLYGVKKKYLTMTFVHPDKGGVWTEYVPWKGVLHEAMKRYSEAKSEVYRKNAEKIMTFSECPECQGARIKPYPAATLFCGRKIHEVTRMTVAECADFFAKVKLPGHEMLLAEELLKGIRERLAFLLDVGLHYLTLDRTAPTLSGGEAQRVRLASQIGCGLVGVTYILDEPSIGLHNRDNKKLIQTLEHLRDQGNSVIVVEHDEETIWSADRVVDFGPLAGVNGGEIIVDGTLQDLMRSKKSLTAQYLRGDLVISSPEKRREQTESALTIEGATHHNLKGIDVKIPLGLFVAITGVSGSGKSSLISDILHPILSNLLHKGEHRVGAHKAILGVDQIDKVIGIDQSPIGRNPRSNPSTYIKLFDEIRDLYAELPESQVRGYKPGRFSFNVKEGSCPACHGMGMVKLDMDFMDETWVACVECKGNRFDHETLSVLYKGKSIYDILEMDVTEAFELFQNIPSLKRKLEVLKDVGLGYIKLGQSSTTLSGGEAQRVKLAKELVRPATGRTLYILDEPTTGLHFHDIDHLLKVLHRLVDRGNSVVVIEHSMDVIKTADWIIDMGPEGGSGGGQVVGQGTPEQISILNTPTGTALKDVFRMDRKAIAKEILAKKKKAAKKNGGRIDRITIEAAEQNNLKRVNAEIPREKITICTGPSGSGKSSFAFETVYAEGQRRYTDSLSPYARQFIEQMPKPKVGLVEGLSPAIAIEQKAHAGNPRSTVGTMTEIYDYLRVLFARVGIPHCPETGEEIRAISKDHVVDKLLGLPEGTPVIILAPLTIRKQDRFEDLVLRYKRQGFIRLRLNGEIYELDQTIPYDKKRKHQIELVIDRLKIGPNLRGRVAEAIENGADIGGGSLIAVINGKDQLFNLTFSVPSTGKSYPEITPKTFAFNTAEGMCPECLGLGTQYGANLAHHPVLRRWNAKELLDGLTESFPKELYKWLEREQGVELKTDLEEMEERDLKVLLEGVEEPILLKNGLQVRWIGLNSLLAKAGKAAVGELKERTLPYLTESDCPFCQGSRVNPLARNVTIAEKSIADICSMPIGTVLPFMNQQKNGFEKNSFLQEVVDQLLSRLGFLEEMGLQYLSLNRRAPTLSGGEAQRIRLARQLGSGLRGVLYVLDEPTIGLHPHDTEKLHAALRRLRDLGNTLLLVEHDPKTMEMADHILDFGPEAGNHGGHITARGTLAELKKNPNSLTGQFLSGSRKIHYPKKKRKRTDPGTELRVIGAKVNNLKKIDLEIPIGQLTCITGVSGSGKSTLMAEVIQPAVSRGLRKNDSVILGDEKSPLATVEGIEQFRQLIVIDQNPIGQTVRADVSTYSDLLAPMREFFAKLPEAIIRGLQPKHFSPNHRQGMCSNCWGLGFKRVEMHFLPAIRVECEECKGLRLNPLSLEVYYQGKNLGQYLQTTVDKARVVFANHKKIVKILDTLIAVGLGYLKLGQEMQTLSGGEAQRIKLSRELNKRSEGRTLYLLDEPTTGLHFSDIEKLIGILEKLVSEGNTVVVIEHNLEFIRHADHLIELGPEAGEGGGYLLFSGKPEDIFSTKRSITGPYLKEVF